MVGVGVKVLRPSNMEGRAFEARILRCVIGWQLGLSRTAKGWYNFLEDNVSMEKSATAGQSKEPSTQISQAFCTETPQRNAFH